MALHALKPSLSEVQSALLSPNATGNIIPVYTSLPSDLLTPVTAYLKLSSGADTSRRSFLFESVTGGEKIGRYSFIGSDPLKIIRTGPGLDAEGDPLLAIEKELSPYKYIPVQGLPTFTGGAIGYISYDCVQYFEPRTKRDLKDVLGIPESVFMVADSLIVFDHVFSTLRCVSHVHLSAELAKDSTPADVEALYNKASEKVNNLIKTLTSAVTPLPQQPAILTGQEAVSNVGKAGSTLPHTCSTLIAVTANSSEHPPETLCKIEAGKVAVHAIAGTVKRGANDAEDEELAHQLASSVKDQAEHVMLVDLARNDINRVCDPSTTQVESFMKVEKFSHVMHLTSRITGQLREGKSRFDALRSIFPAGTVSGAPKIRAIELVSELEKEKRGVYAGAVGRIDFADQEMDVCIAIRTMTFKGGYAYLQAGGGIVYDSVEEDEYVETINKLGANIRCIAQAEEYYLAQEEQ
ncbi:hypothetical protein NDA11_004587 [Ustilago hordei]|nr:hypothetical protein NDA11_004587 [Ustilago hordei]